MPVQSSNKHNRNVIIAMSQNVMKTLSRLDKGRCSIVFITDFVQIFIHFVVFCKCDCGCCFGAFERVTSSDQLTFDYWNLFNVFRTLWYMYARRFLQKWLTAFIR